MDQTAEIIERHQTELAGVIVEPMQRIVPPEPGFLEALREMTQRYQIALIFDEIVTGFRLAFGGAQEYYGVVPDLCTLGKIVGGGFPLAAVTGRADLMQCFNPSARTTKQFTPQIGTLSGNPVAAAAGLATLDVLREPGTYEKLFATGQQLMTGLGAAFAKAGTPVRICGEPPVFDVLITDQDISSYRDTLSNDKAAIGRFNQQLLSRGIFRPDSKFYVSIVHSQGDVDQTLAVFDAAAAAM